MRTACLALYCVYIFVLPEGRAKLVAQGQQECIQHIADFIKGKMYEAIQQKKEQTSDTHRLPAYWQVVVLLVLCFVVLGVGCTDWRDARGN